MTARGDTRVGLALIVALGLGPGCSKSVPRSGTAQVGHHRVRFVLPAGWEHLDHGRQQLFRLNEAQLTLADLGPATRAGMLRELHAARDLWLAGRRRDAFERVRELRSPALRFAPWQRRLEFWTPWTDATYSPETADSAAIGPAFDALIQGTQTLPNETPDLLLAYVDALTAERPGREVHFRKRVTIHDADWMDVETWSRVSHMNRSRTAFVVNGGYLLVLDIDRGVYERTGPAFDALLASLEVAPAAR